MAHADKGMGGAEASAAHSAGARQDTKQAGNTNVSKKFQPGKVRKHLHPDVEGHAR